jgi:hypothetical protein
MSSSKSFLQLGNWGRSYSLSPDLRTLIFVHNLSAHPKLAGELFIFVL